MKKILLMALAAAFITACSENEPVPEVYNGPSEQFNILTSVVGSRAAETPDGVIGGTSMPSGSAIGVHVTQTGESGAEAYTGVIPTVESAKYYENGTNVYFKEVTVGGSGSAWKSYDTSTKAEETKLYIGATEGTVYAYYPFAATVTGLGDAATVPVTLLTTGNINTTTATIASTKTYYDAAEIDYLYYKPGGSGRAKVSSSATTTAALTMAHAMASVSFCMYVSYEAPALTEEKNGDTSYYLMGYTIKNSGTGTARLRAQTSGVTHTMNIATGVIAGSTTDTGGEIKRTINAVEDPAGRGVSARTTTINGYALKREESSGSKPNDLIWFSNLAIPIEAITQGDIDVVFSIKKGKNGTPANYTVPLKVTASTGDSGANKDGSDMWLAGNNYQYTVKVNAFTELSIDEVTVTDWVPITGGDMEIQ